MVLLGPYWGPYGCRSCIMLSQYTEMHLDHPKLSFHLALLQMNWPTICVRTQTRVLRKLAYLVPCWCFIMFPVSLLASMISQVRVEVCDWAYC